MLPQGVDPETVRKYTLRAPAPLLTAEEKGLRERASTLVIPNLQILNRMPLELPPDVATVYLGRGTSGVAVLLGTVENINKLPKRLKLKSQVVMPFWERTCEQLLLVKPNGDIYLVLHT